MKTFTLLLFACSYLLASCGAKPQTRVASAISNNSLSGFGISNSAGGIISGQVVSGTCMNGSLISVSSPVLQGTPLEVFCIDGKFSVALKLNPEVPATGSADLKFEIESIYGSPMGEKTITFNWAPAVDNGSGDNSGIGGASSTATSEGSSLPTSSSSSSIYIVAPQIDSLSCTCSESGCSITASCTGSGPSTATISANPYTVITSANVPLFTVNATLQCANSGASASLALPEFDHELARIDLSSGALVVVSAGGKSATCAYINTCASINPDTEFACALANTPEKKESFGCNCAPPEESNECGCSLDAEATSRCISGANLFRTSTWLAENCQSSSVATSSSSEQSSALSSIQSSVSSITDVDYSSSSSVVSVASSSSSTSAEEEQSSSLSSEVSTPLSNYRAKFTSQMYSDSLCQSEVANSYVVVVQNSSNEIIGNYGTTTLYPNGAWLSWAWTFYPIWEFRTTSNPTGTVFYKTPEGVCTPGFNASANFSGAIL